MDKRLTVLIYRTEHIGHSCPSLISDILILNSVLKIGYNRAVFVFKTASYQHALSFKNFFTRFPIVSRVNFFNVHLDLPIRSPPPHPPPLTSIGRQALTTQFSDGPLVCVTAMVAGSVVSTLSVTTTLRVMCLSLSHDC